VRPGIPARLLRSDDATAFIHSALGGLAVLAAVTILLRMNKLLPKALRFRGWKNLMRLTLGLYWLVGLFGIGTYLVWYVLPLGAAGGPAVAGENSVVVPVANFAFNPGGLDIPVGTTVVFRNQDPAPHTVTSDTGAFPEAVLAEQQEATFTFTEPGTFAYFCLYHGGPGGVGMAGVIRVGSAAAALPVPTAVEPPEPTAPPTPEQLPAEALAAEAVGYGAFRDGQAHSDEFVLRLAGLPAEPGGDLHAWLTGPAPLHLGPIAPDGSGGAEVVHTDPTGRNLLAEYTGFLVTVEAAGETPAAPSGQVLVESQLAEGLAGPVRQLLVESDQAPDGTPYALGLIQMAEELVRHARAVNGAAVLGDTQSQHRHSEHMLTLLQGAGGEHYRDLDGDGEVQDPGDGFGLLRYARALGEQARAAAAVPGAGSNVLFLAARLQLLAGNLEGWNHALTAELLAAEQAGTAAERQAHTGQALQLAQNLLDGADANGNGQVEAIAGEGGAYLAYFHAQYLAALGAVPRPGAGFTLPASTPAPTGTPPPTRAAPPTQPAAPTAAASEAPAVAPTETPTQPPATDRPPATEPPATATPAPSASPTEAASPTPSQAPTPAPVTITYRNFDIAPVETTIAAGTRVTFLIQDSLHQPYNFDAPNVFEAPANLGPGSTYSFTFNEPGTTTLLCGYHSDMRATLHVTP
jgi:plastocyanin